MIIVFVISVSGKLRTPNGGIDVEVRQSSRQICRCIRETSCRVEAGHVNELKLPFSAKFDEIIFVTDRLKIESYRRCEFFFHHMPQHISQPCSGIFIVDIFRDKLVIPLFDFPKLEGPVKGDGGIVKRLVRFEAVVPNVLGATEPSSGEPGRNRPLHSFHRLRNIQQVEGRGMLAIFGVGWLGRLARRCLRGWRRRCWIRRFQRLGFCWFGLGRLEGLGFTRSKLVHANPVRCIQGNTPADASVFLPLRQ